MGKINIDQSHTVMAILGTNVDWDSIDFEESGLQDLVIRDSIEAGKQFTSFLKNGARVIVGEPKIISIDRSEPFNPEFIGNGWSIEEQDEKSLALTEIDLTAIRFKSMLKDGEKSVKGEEELSRLKSEKYICLDAKIFQTLWENQILIPEKWKEKTNGNTTYIFFDGTILRNPYGGRCVLYLFWDYGKWHWSSHWLGHHWRVGNPSAVLVSN